MQNTTAHWFSRHKISSHKTTDPFEHSANTENIVQSTHNDRRRKRTEILYKIAACCLGTFDENNFPRVLAPSNQVSIETKFCLRSDDFPRNIEKSFTLTRKLHQITNFLMLLLVVDVHAGSGACPVTATRFHTLFICLFVYQAMCFDFVYNFSTSQWVVECWFQGKEQSFFNNPEIKRSEEKGEKFQSD